MNKRGGKVPGEHGNASGMYGSGCKVPGECWKMQGNARGTYGSGCKLPGEYRATYGSGCSARGIQRSAGEFRGMPGKRMGVSVNC